MKVAKEDLLWIRTYIAEKYGKEFTPQQILEILKKAKHVEISDQFGLLSTIKRRMDANGDSSPC